MTLRHHDDDAGPRCAACGAPAAGPCASCGRMLCGDHAVVVRGAAKPFAVCARCEGRGETALRRGWTGLLVWLGGMFLLLAGLTALAGWLAARR